MVLTKQKWIEIRKKLYFDDEGDFRNYCLICDKSSIHRYFNNHLKSQTYINKFRKRQHLYNTNISTSQ